MSADIHRHAALQGAEAFSPPSPASHRDSDCIVADLVVAFDAATGQLNESTHAAIRHWGNTWRTRHPGAVVVMGCNGKSRNTEREIRVSRLRAIAVFLGECGVPEERIRYTDEIVEADADGTPISPHRGVVRLKAFRSAAIDAAIVPIRQLFGSSVADRE